MQQILNQVRIFLLSIARLLWLVAREIVRLLCRGIRYGYRHRVQIVRYRYTLSILMALSVLWAGWRLRNALTEPAVVAEGSFAQNATAENQPEKKPNPYAVLTSDTDAEAPEQPANMALISSIYQWLGTPHRDGGTSKNGTDCSYFVQRVYQEAYGIQLNRSSRRMYSEDVQAIRKDELHEGDLVFFDTGGDGISHVGIYLRNNTFVHASSSKGVIVESLASPYYQKHYAASGRVRR